MLKNYYAYNIYMAFYKKKYQRPVYREPTDVDRKLALKKNKRGTAVLVGRTNIPYEYTARYLDLSEFQADIASLLSVFNEVADFPWSLETSSLVDIYENCSDFDQENGK